MQDRVFYSICFGFVLGVLLRSFVFVNVYFAIFVGVLAFFLVLIFSLISLNKWGILGSVFILTFCFGIFRFHIVDVSAPSIFESQVGKNASFSGIIVDEPDIRENNQKLTIETRIEDEKTKILATV